MQDKIIEIIKKYNNIAILGFGREGKSTYNFIRNHDKSIKLTILDAKEIELDDPYAIYKPFNNLESELEEFDLIIKTPGISFKDFSKKTKDKVTSQMELLLEVNRKNVIGITGTKGKSTTSSLIYTILKDQLEKVFLVGNIGVPVLDKIEDYENAIIVAEMSSHQLEFVKASPHIGIIVNLFIDHLDHAGTVENYHNSKVNIIRYQDEEDYAIYDSDNYYLQNMNFSGFKGKKCTVSSINEADIYLKGETIFINKKELFDKSRIKTKLQGDHNFKNIMFALYVASIFNLDLEKAIKSLETFQPLEHRMEFFGNYKGIDFYDDAIATIPEATINACNTIKNIETLIFGGLDRNIDYSKLIEYLNNSDIKHLICMPSTAHKLIPFLNKDKIIKVDTLEEAVAEAFKVTSNGKACILSPAAASYEFFKNFEEKGNRFKELVRENK